MANTNELKGVFVDFLSHIILFWHFLPYCCFVCILYFLILCIFRSLLCIYFCVFFFVLSKIILVCFAYLFSKEREKEGMELGRKGGSRKSWGRRNGDQNIKNLFSIKKKLNMLILGSRQLWDMRCGFELAF